MNNAKARRRFYSKTNPSNGINNVMPARRYFNVERKVQGTDNIQGSGASDAIVAEVEHEEVEEGREVESSEEL